MLVQLLTPFILYSFNMLLLADSTLALQQLVKHFTELKLKPAEDHKKAVRELKKYTCNYR